MTMKLMFLILSALSLIVPTSGAQAVWQANVVAKNGGSSARTAATFMTDNEYYDLFGSYGKFGYFYIALPKKTRGSYIILRVKDNAYCGSEFRQSCAPIKNSVTGVDGDGSIWVVCWGIREFSC